MEDVLSVYTRPRDPDRPLVCLDETSKQLVAESRSPMAVRPGSPTRVDYQYTRNGVANLMVFDINDPGQPAVPLPRRAEGALA